MNFISAMNRSIIDLAEECYQLCLIDKHCTYPKYIIIDAFREGYHLGERKSELKSLEALADEWGIPIHGRLTIEDYAEQYTYICKERGDCDFCDEVVMFAFTNGYIEQQRWDFQQ